MDNHDEPTGLSEAELAAEEGIALPDKEVVSILDLNADLDLAIDTAAPIDLGAAANANVAAPIDAGVGANVLSEGSTAQALSDQGALINQGLTADATAHAVQDSGLEQGAAADGADGATVGDAGTTDTGTTDAGSTGTDAGTTVGSAADGNLLNVDVNLDANTDLAAPINGAVAANANVAAPIDASVAANVGSVDSDAVSIAQQDAIINQTIDGSATATSDQASDISQP
jgi:hypothetical protein